jgi:tetratricopeptide (TPR) repeat protein
VGATGRDDRPDPGHQPVEWQFVEEVRAEASDAVRRAGSSPAPKARRGRPPRAPGAGSGGVDARAELQRALGPAGGAKANDRLRDAAGAFARDRYEEARTLLRPLADKAPGAPSVRELYGLTLYRLGRWKAAGVELEAFRNLTGSTEQHPVLADCYRALGRHREVEELWEELRDASPSADLVAEGRIVMAGSLADRGQLAAAIKLLEFGPRLPKRPEVHHLRMAYALADLHESAGDVARARELFRWIASFEPDFVDAAQRAASLG